MTHREFASVRYNLFQVMFEKGIARFLLCFVFIVLGSASQAHAAADKAVLSDNVIHGVAGALRAISAQSRDALAYFFNDFSSNPTAAAASLLQRLPPDEVVKETEILPSDDRELLNLVAPAFRRHADSLSDPWQNKQMIGKLAVAESFFVQRLPEGKLVPLIASSESLLQEHPELRLRSMRSTLMAQALARLWNEHDHSDSKTPSTSFPDDNLLSPFAWSNFLPLKEERVGGLKRFSDVSPRDFPNVRNGIQELASRIKESQIDPDRPILLMPSGDASIPSEDDIRMIYFDDARTRLSQLYHDSKGKLIGFVLASFSEDERVVLLKALGAFDREGQQEEIAKQMLHAVARRALEMTIPLVTFDVDIGDSPTIRLLSYLGFQNSMVWELTQDTQYKVFRFIIPAHRLMQTTRNPQPTSVIRSLPTNRDRAASIYRSSNPRSNTLSQFERYNLNLAAIISEILYFRVGINTLGHTATIKTMAPWHADPDLKMAIKEILDFAGQSQDNPQALRFVTWLAEGLATYNFERADFAEMARFKWPTSPLAGEYWDLASGPNAAAWILAGLDPKAHYRLFDVDDFTIAYLRRIADLARNRRGMTAKVSVEKQDIRLLERPEASLAAVRVKNISGYVPESAEIIARMTEWLAPGGQLIIQNVPVFEYRRNDIRILYDLINSLIEHGWEFEGNLLSTMKPDFYVFLTDTLKLTKPLAPMDETTARQFLVPFSQGAWIRYLKAVSDSQGSAGS